METHRTVFGLGFFITGLSLAGLLIPEPATSFTSLLPSGNDAAFTLLLGSILMILAWTAYFAEDYWSTFLGILGGSLTSLSIAGIFYPMYFGLITSYIRPANVLALLITGISYIIVALEIDRTAARLALVAGDKAQAVKPYHQGVRAIRQASVDVAKKVRRPRLASPHVPLGEPL